MKVFIKKHFPEIIISTIISSSVSFPLAGFLFGFIISTGGSGGILSELKGRFIIGIISAVASSYHYGRLWGDDPSMEAYVLKFRIFVFFIFILLFIIFFRLFKRLRKASNFS